MHSTTDQDVTNILDGFLLSSEKQWVPDVQVTPHGPVWRRHWEQLQPRHSSTEDSEPGETINFTNFELSDLWNYQRSLSKMFSKTTSQYLSMDLTIPEDLNGQENRQ